MSQNNKNTFKEFGLKYIDEMAQEREHAKKEVSINILNLKNSQLQSSSVNPSWHDFESFVDSARNQVVRIFDGQLTKLTIKSLGKMRKLISGNEGFSLTDDEVSKGELEKIQKEVAHYKELVEKVKKEKYNERADFELVFEEIKNESRELIDKIKDKELLEKKLQAQVESLEKNYNEANEEREKAIKEVESTYKTVELLIDQGIVKKQDIDMIAPNIGEIQAYNAEQQKIKLEELRERTRNELAFEYELTINDLENRLKQEKEIVSETETKIKEIEQKNRNYREEIEKDEEKIKKTEKEYSDLKETIDISSKTLNFIQSMLSTHPLYSSIMILANLGGTMTLDALAKSVGAAPLRLRHLMEDLVERELIVIEDGENPKVRIIRDY